MINSKIEKLIAENNHYFIVVEENDEISKNILLPIWKIGRFDEVCN